MTVDEILKSIHREYDGDVNYPTSGEDFDLRIGLINDAILKWKSTKNTRWKELITKQTGTTDGSNEIACPSDFVDIMSQLKIGGIPYGFQPPIEARRLLMAGSTGKFFFISGSPSAYKINVNPTPEANLPYEYYYYRRAPKVSSVNDEVVVPEPLFIINWVLARLYKLDNQLTTASSYEQEAINVLNDMIANNETTGGLASNSLLDDDVDYKLYGERFGK